VHPVPPRAHDPAPGDDALQELVGIAGDADLVDDVDTFLYRPTGSA
jgi:hypothetical protein